MPNKIRHEPTIVRDDDCRWVDEYTAPLDQVELELLVRRVTTELPGARERSNLVRHVTKWLTAEARMWTESKARRELVAAVRNLLADRVSRLRAEIRDAETVMARLSAEATEW